MIEYEIFFCFDSSIIFKNKNDWIKISLDKSVPNTLDTSLFQKTENYIEDITDESDLEYESESELIFQLDLKDSVKQSDYIEEVKEFIIVEHKEGTPRRKNIRSMSEDLSYQKKNNKSLFIDTKINDEDEDELDSDNIQKRKSFLNSMFNKLKNSVYNIFSPKSL